MTFIKRYIFKNGLDLIAPGKCGTRWLSSIDDTHLIETIHLNVYELKDNVHSDTIFVWRPIEEHILSAINTDMGCTPKSISEILYDLENEKSRHWYPFLYKQVYDSWCIHKFRFVKLRQLSELFPIDMVPTYSYNKYEFIKVDCVLSNKLNRLAEMDSKYLETMISHQYSQYDWNDYSKLEDKNLLQVDKIKKLEYEISSHMSKIGELENKNVSDISKIEELEIKIKKLNYLNLVQKDIIAILKLKNKNLI
jgi:hypothetical protein